MADFLKKVQPGERLAIPAAAYNAFIDAAVDLRGRQSNELGGGKPVAWSNTIIPVQNNTGMVLTQYAIVGLSAPVFSPAASLDAFLSRPAMVGVVPALATHAGRFAVLLEPAGIGEIARAYVSGVCSVQISVTDATHTFAEVTNGSVVNLTSGTTGSAVILWKEAGTGSRWAVVRIDNSGSALPPGTTTAQMLYWDQTALEWKLLAPPPLDGLMYILTAQDAGTGARTLAWVDGTECEGDQVDGGTY